jgi:hypothetical protein
MRKREGQPKGKEAYEHLMSKILACITGRRDVIVRSLAVDVADITPGIGREALVCGS